MDIIQKNTDQLTENEIYQIKKVLDPYYEDCSELLKKTLSHNTNIYLASEEKKIICFYMVGIFFAEDNQKIIHLGLSGCRQSNRNKKIIQKLYDLQMVEIEKEPSSTIIYSTTASPIIFNYARRIFPKTEPKIDFTYIPDAIEDIKKIAEAKNWTLNSTYPFLLESFAPNTKYAPDELDILEAYCKEKNFNLENIGLKAERGDRLILLHRL